MSWNAFDEVRDEDIQRDTNSDIIDPKNCASEFHYEGIIYRCEKKRDHPEPRHGCRLISENSYEGDLSWFD